MSQLVTEIMVGLEFGSGIQPVGRLAIRDRTIYFEFHEGFLQKGLGISPFRLPIQQGVIELSLHPFEGLAGVFSDSLPDGWGRLLFDRMLRAKGILPVEISPLDRLAHVGLWGMGALIYQPDQSSEDLHHMIDLDQLAVQTEDVLKGSSPEVIDELLALNGSSAGARPKALIGVDADREHICYGAKQLKPGFGHWIVKFPNSQEGVDAGAIEYTYAILAKEAGLIVPDVYLFSSQIRPGYFAVKRFDREGDRRFHMHTASGLLHSDFRAPSLDYEDLLNLTGALTKDIREIERMYRLAVFNVLAHNRDDHAKNFSYLMNSDGEWKLAPAYDLTFSSGPSGEQSTMVMGEGKNPGISHLEKLGLEAGLPQKLIKEIIDQTKMALAQWETLAKGFGVSESSISMIARSIKKIG